LLAFETGQIGSVKLRNRIIKAATFEGVMPYGAVTTELIDFHVSVARGGAAMTTVAYGAISKGGRVSPHTMVLRDELVPDLAQLTDAVHDEGAAVAIQIGHAGLVAQGHSKRNPSLAPSTRFAAPAKGIVRAGSKEQLNEVINDFKRAAKAAESAGFDALEIHLGHNYLLSSFLSPNLNKRKDDYGGSLEARSRFPRRVIEAVRSAVGPQMAVYAKFNMDDGVAQGIHPDESLQIAKWLESDGHLDALELTGGSSLLNGMYFFRGDVPMKEFADAQPKLIGLVFPLIGKRIFPTIPFEEAFFLPMAREFRAELKMPLILLGGINKVETIENALGDEGFDLVAMGRALLRNPNLINELSERSRTEGNCIHCNRCMPSIYSGTRCVVDAPDPIVAHPLSAR